MKQSLDFKLHDDGLNHKIKFHQICKMNWLIIEYRNAETYAISKKDFIAWACTVKKSSIAYKDVVNIGKVITGMEWLKNEV